MDQKTKNVLLNIALLAIPELIKWVKSQTPDGKIPQKVWDELRDEGNETNDLIQNTA